MPVKQLIKGRKHKISAWIEGGSCQVETFLSKLRINSPQNCTEVIALIAKASRFGPPENEEVCRLADKKKAGDLYLFLTGGGICVFWFYYKTNIVIISCVNVSDFASEITNAFSIKRKFAEEIEHDLFKQSRRNLYF